MFSKRYQFADMGFAIYSNTKGGITDINDVDVYGNYILGDELHNTQGLDMLSKFSRAHHSTPWNVLQVGMDSAQIASLDSEPRDSDGEPRNRGSNDDVEEVEEEEEKENENIAPEETDGDGNEEASMTSEGDQGEGDDEEGNEAAVGGVPVPVPIRKYLEDGVEDGELVGEIFVADCPNWIDLAHRVHDVYQAVDGGDDNADIDPSTCWPGYEVSFWMDETEVYWLDYRFLEVRDNLNEVRLVPLPSEEEEGQEETKKKRMKEIRRKMKKSRMKKRRMVKWRRMKFNMIQLRLKRMRKLALRRMQQIALWRMQQIALQRM